MSDFDQEDVIKEFSQRLLKKEKEYLRTLTEVRTDKIIDDLYDIFEEVVKKYEDKENNN